MTTVKAEDAEIEDRRDGMFKKRKAMILYCRATYILCPALFTRLWSTSFNRHRVRERSGLGD